MTNTNNSGPGSLRDALAAANDGDEITFAVTGTITLTSGELVVDKSIRISGPGPGNLAVDGDATSRVFHIGPSVTVTLADLTVTNGFACCGIIGGGGIYNDHATLTVEACAISDNNAFIAGGGVYNDSELGEAVLKITDSTISVNGAVSGGAALTTTAQMATRISKLSTARCTVIRRLAAAASQTGLPLTAMQRCKLATRH